MKRELLPDGRQRFSLEKVPCVLVRAARRLTVGTLRDDAFVTRHPGLLRAVELGGRESEAREALKFGDESIKASRHAVIRHECLKSGLVPSSSAPERATDLPRLRGMADSGSG